jgi:CheY-like chemotaxis protein
MSATILVIDDCEELRETVHDILVDSGYGVALAADPEEADQRLQDHNFTLILCDLVMPIETADDHEEDNDSAMVGVHGINRLSKRYPEIPIIAMSGKLTGDPLNIMRRFGAADTLSKPFTREELLRTVAGSLK